MFNFLSISTTSVLLIVIFVSFFCAFLLIENNKLREKLQKAELENKKLLEVKVSKQKNVDSVSINKISTTEKKQTANNQNKKIELVQKYQPKETKTISNNTNDNNKLYQKNILHDKPNITSPISITKPEEVKLDLNEFIKTNELKIDNNVEEKTNEKIKREEVKITNSKKNNNIEYLQGISNKMADELKPQTIELTDYEKIQEENAVISYKELLSVKDKIMMLDDEDETVNFIEELKNLRNSLK